MPTCNFTFFFCTPQSVFRIMDDHGNHRRLSLSHNCTVKIWSHMGQMKNNFGTLPLRLQQWRPCHWQDYGGYQDKQNCHCIVARVELEKDASFEKISKKIKKSTIRKAKLHKRNTKLDIFGETGFYVQLCIFPVLVLFRFILDHGSLSLSHSTAILPRPPLP